MPRDSLLCVGPKIIEAPMSWRSRRNDNRPYYPLLQRLSRDHGYEWLPAPQPLLRDSRYQRSWSYLPSRPLAPFISDDEPTFDAADFVRLGRDLVVQESCVTNNCGIEYVRGRLDPDFRIHPIRFYDDKPMHIDATLVPLRPGTALINPERVPPQLERELQRGLFKDWEFLAAPQPALPPSAKLCFSSAWLNMNVLSLDERHVVVEASDNAMADLLSAHGFTPIPCPFRNVFLFGGSFHCVTLDICRAGGPQTVLTR